MGTINGGYLSSDHELVAEWVFGILNEGAESYRLGTCSPYRGDDVRHSIHAHGWVMEDLRCSLIRADPDGYGKYNKIK